MRCGLTRDEEASADLTEMEPVGVVEQFHDPDLCEGDAELEERLLRNAIAGSDGAAFRVDDLTSRGDRSS
jgi:hypothetical protein